MQLSRACRQRLGFTVSGRSPSRKAKGRWLQAPGTSASGIEPTKPRFANTKSLPSSAGSGRSYFLPRLLRELVFAEQQLAGLALKGEQRRERLQLGLLAAIAALSVTLLAAWAAWWDFQEGPIAEWLLILTSLYLCLAGIVQQIVPDNRS